MISFLMARLGLSGLSGMATSLARPLTYLAAALAILASVWAGKTWDENRFEAVRSDMIKLADARVSERGQMWAASIAAANAEVAKREAERERAAAALSAQLVARREESSARISELERATAALPSSGSGGLDRERVRLLRRQSAPAPSRSLRDAGLPPRRGETEVQSPGQSP
jgi:hypothetical protein